MQYSITGYYIYHYQLIRHLLFGYRIYYYQLTGYTLSFCTLYEPEDLSFLIFVKMSVVHVI